mmetsp:Transcript_3252/g.8044  ORF Transcript_3252/g.8044 Transcript_3252/m.8044 type:complete len:232 (+) Transcript_3252:1-696(+)|eukprot:CAMPEP_0198234298 /NCGR_PEP_ID=MMETSP1446-20131203/353_1 /TAXON_ID=1461542 ORGANISM="Unidentified sp, Strain CCMP2111" /NCGR_SAMPLE_ID=MMETSP1446 /ASSEMBLY_ACC=CAM_ASM_001112 /LENGTH=231 /DNA_ID=CAMNT_0043915055 /DNA_START=1 /DNA_END=696 /DNA_ORIENTATION=-
MAQGGDGAMVLYAFVGKGRTVWCDANAGWNGGQAAIANPQKTAVQMLAKLTEEGKYNFKLTESRMAYAIVDEGIVYGCISHSSLSTAAAMVFLSDVKDQFCSQFSKVDRTTAPENTPAFRRFSITIKRAMEVAYSGGQEKLDSVKRQIEDTKNVMAVNISKVLERGERLEDVMDKSEKMKDTADAFRRKGKELRRKMWWQNTKFKLIIAAVVIVLLLLLFFGICRGVSCVK